MKQVLATCPVCQREFDAYRTCGRLRRTCTRKACQRRHQSRLRTGKAPSPACMQARTARSRRLFTAFLDGMFRQLSDRELEIVRATYRIAWMRGWNKAQARYFKEVGRAA